MSLSLLTALLLAACIAGETAYQTSFKLVASRAQPEHMIASVVAQPLLWVAIALWAAEAVAWILVLHEAPLDSAYPIMCLTYASVPLAGALLLKERLSPRQLAGAMLVLIGVLAVALSSVKNAP